MLKCWTIARWVLAVAVIAKLPSVTSANDAILSVDSAARQFRVQLYQSFRADRGEYDRRLRFAKLLIDDWRFRGAPMQEAFSIIDWMRRAAQPGTDLPIYRRQPIALHQNSASAQSTRTRARRRRSPPPAKIIHPVPPRSTAVEPRVPNRVSSPSDQRVPLSTVRMQSTPPTPSPRLPELAASPAPRTALSFEPHLGAGNDDQSDSKQPSVDLQVLAAHIRATNLRLSEIESELLETGLWDARRLEPLVQRFDRVFRGQHLSRLYYGALDEEERSNLKTALASTRPVLDLLSQRWFEARVAVADATERRKATEESERLESISKTIESWKTENPGYR